MISIDTTNIKSKIKTAGSMTATILHKGKIQKVRDTFDVTYDFDPETCHAALIQANSGCVSRQSRIAQEIIEKDTDIRQAWGTRIASLSALDWEIGGEAGPAAEAAAMLRAIRPGDDEDMVSFWELIQSLQSANLHGFALAEIIWSPGGSQILGFRPCAQSWCSIDAANDRPALSLEGGGELNPSGPGWIFHRVGDRAVSAARTGLVRPLSWLFCFKRQVMLGNVRFLEKFGMPIPVGTLPAYASDEALDESGLTKNAERQKFEEMLETLGSEGWVMMPKDYDFRLVQPTLPSSNQYQDFLAFAARQAWRLILGQDSTSSAADSNRSTADVHDLVRRDILIADAMAVSQTISRILGKWSIMRYGRDLGLQFNFKLKPEASPATKAQLLQAATAAGFSLSPEDASAFLGIPGLIAKPTTPKPQATP